MNKFLFQNFSNSEIKNPVRNYKNKNSLGYNFSSSKFQKEISNGVKIAIISDSHDNLANLKKALSFIEKEEIGVLIHCGDVCSPSTLDEILNNFSGKFHLAIGNADGDFSNFDRREFGGIVVENKKIAFSHLPEIAKDLTLSQKYDFVFYGHTHKPWEEKIGKTKLVNPGNIAGLYFRPTFAILDTKTKKLRLKFLTN